MHEPVMLEAVMTYLQPTDGGTYVDGTGGGGGHAEALMRAVGPTGRVVVFDRDAEALDRVRRRLTGLPGTLVAIHADFRQMAAVLESHGIAAVDGVLLDLGMSSDQLDDPDRGFGFQSDGPLDMRFDRQLGKTAFEMVSTLQEKTLCDLLSRYGEEPRARVIAAAMVRVRTSVSLNSTRRLAALIEEVKPRRGARIHPATQTFQALRIAVNDELGALEQGIESALSRLRPGGRLAVIAFHSLEDRIVKRFMRAHEGRYEALPQGGREWRGSLPRARRITRRPVRADASEIQTNPRSRSARLRVLERLST